MKLLRPIGLLTALLVLQPVPHALAQGAGTTVDGLTLSESLQVLTAAGGSTATGQAIALATALEVATAPMGASSAGFAFKLDPATGLMVRTATTFGPAFAERALTSGAGKISVAANLIVSTYDKLGSYKLSGFELGRLESPNQDVARTGNASLVMSSQTFVLYGAIGATDSLDLSVAVPMVKVKLEGLSWVQSQRGDVLQRTEASGIASGIGDIAIMAKYRLLRFGEGEPDPGGVALLGTMRLPTGDTDNLRGLGITRTMAALVASTGRGRIRPHGSAGFEFWSDGIDIVADPSENPAIVTARNQIQYNVGLEYEAAPKVTLIADILGRHILGAGHLDAVQFAIPNQPNVTSFTALSAVSTGLRKITLAPGLKWNVKGQALLSLNALIPLFDNGLHDQFTPVVGLDITF